jgi:hypothetical protein
MWRNHALLSLSLCVLGPGCETPVGSGLEVCRYSTRNFLEAPVSARDDCKERSWERDQGKAAWQAFQTAHPDQAFSVHYRNGFVDGFADYLYAGGTANPPVVPPWYYRTEPYETPEGLEEVRDWFAGFRDGAGAAQESGLRRLIVVPVTLPGTAPLPQPPTSARNMISAPKRPIETTLPPPRPLREPGAPPDEREKP